MVIAVALLWIALAALAIGALDWLFPAWHGAKTDSHNEQGMNKMLWLRHLRSQAAPERYPLRSPGPSAEQDNAEFGDGEPGRSSVRSEARRPSEFGSRLDDFVRGLTIKNHTATDPVCRMQIDPEIAPAKAEYKGQTYYFCCRGCKAVFEKDPEYYGGRAA